MSERKACLLRIDADLWKELERWAEAELRSTNGQVEWILRESVRRRKRGLPIVPGEAESAEGREGAAH